MSKAQVTNDIPTKCAHGLPLADPNEPCIDCEIDSQQAMLHDHMTKALTCANRLADLARRKRSASS